MIPFMQFAADHGLIVERLTYGSITRCKTLSNPNKQNGAYLYSGEFGWCQDWARHESPVIWLSGDIKDHAEVKQKIKDSKQKYNEDRIKTNQDAANKAHWILSQCELDISAYLGRKGFPDMCANVWKREGNHILVIPMRAENKLIGCQLIDAEGGKRFLKGQATKDACFQIGNGDLNFFVEGYVSGLSLQKILQSIKISYTLYVTFSAGNLLRFARRIDGFVIADNDESETGESAAIESGRRYWMPSVIGWDVNDYLMNSGTFKAAQEIKKLIYSST